MGRQGETVFVSRLIAAAVRRQGRAAYSAVYFLSILMQERREAEAKQRCNVRLILFTRELPNFKEYRFLHKSQLLIAIAIKKYEEKNIVSFLRLHNASILYRALITGQTKWFEGHSACIAFQYQGRAYRLW